MERTIMVFDIDGCVCDDSARRHLMVAGDYQAYHEAGAKANEPPINSAIVDWARSHCKEIIFLTGRPESFRVSTEEWLEEWLMGGDPYTLLMREDSDMRSTPEMKVRTMECFLEQIDANKEDILAIYDDREDVIAAYINAGFRGAHILRAPATESEGRDTGAHYRFEYKGIKLDPARIVSIYEVDNLRRRAPS